MKVAESLFVSVLFGLYIALWWAKGRQLKRQTGRNPNVMKIATSPIQRYMNELTGAMMLYIVLMIILHSIQLQVGSLFTRIPSLERLPVDIIGFAVGMSGLAVCGYAQQKMGQSWRVGIDDAAKTELITTGLYRFIRNPTYLGLFALCFGVWLIWPTWTIFLFAVVFIMFLEIQVRCEEEYLIKAHGEKYVAYMKATKRYIPYIY